MPTEQERARLAQVKLALAEKYARLARVSGSRPRRSVLSRRSEGYRRQAAQLLRK
jgi:hypothetical protein